MFEWRGVNGSGCYQKWTLAVNYHSINLLFNLSISSSDRKSYHSTIPDSHVRNYHSTSDCNVQNYHFIWASGIKNYHSISGSNMKNFPCYYIFFYLLISSKELPNSNSNLMNSNLMNSNFKYLKKLLIISFFRFHFFFELKQWPVRFIIVAHFVEMLHRMKVCVLAIFTMCCECVALTVHVVVVVVFLI